jgi:hypothetical protein
MLLQLSGVIGILAIVAAASGGIFAAESIVISSDLSAFRRASVSDLHWLFGATLGAPLTLRDWIVILAVLAFTGLNFFLWSLPISQLELFFISAPLGAAALALFMWFAPRK